MTSYDETSMTKLFQFEVAISYKDMGSESSLSHQLISFKGIPEKKIPGKMVPWTKNLPIKNPRENRPLKKVLGEKIPGKMVARKMVYGKKVRSLEKRYFRNLIQLIKTEPLFLHLR